MVLYILLLKIKNQFKNPKNLTGTFPKQIISQINIFSEFSEMLDLVRFTDCHTSFTQMDNKFEQKVDEEAPYLCQIKQGSENEIDGPYLFHYSTFY